MRLEKELQCAIMRTIEEGVREAMSQFGEEYVTGKELCKRFQMFTPNWLKLYGHLLPRTRAEVTEQSGEKHVTGWCYPVSKIGRMVENGEIKRLCNRGRVISVKVSNGEVRAKLVINASK